MTSPPNLQNEPTMEEILASIRKIISEDQSEAAKSAAPAPAEEAAHDDSPVLELTREVRDDGSIARVTAEPAPAPARNNGDDTSFAARQTMTPEIVELAHEDIISDSARNALGRSFAAMESSTPQREKEAAMPAEGNLNAAFERAVQAAFQPAIHEWIDGRSGEIMEQLKPLIRQWMDDNLPALIENAVRNEIARAVRNRGR